MGILRSREVKELARGRLVQWCSTVLGTQALSVLVPVHPSIPKVI